LGGYLGDAKFKKHSQYFLPKKTGERGGLSIQTTLYFGTNFELWITYVLGWRE